MVRAWKGPNVSVMQGKKCQNIKSRSAEMSLTEHGPFRPTHSNRDLLSMRHSFLNLLNAGLGGYLSANCHTPPTQATGLLNGEKHRTRQTTRVKICSCVVSTRSVEQSEKHLRSFLTAMLATWTDSSPKDIRYHMMAWRLAVSKVESRQSQINMSWQDRAAGRNLHIAIG